jgi:predicted metal-dependent HD superfamily phosphohydrolase
MDNDPYGLSSHWQQAWAALDLPAPAAPLADLLRRYAEPHRHYHTQQHLHECFTQFALLRAAAGNAPALLLALWFHDAVYDTHAHDNEAQSAALADAVLREHGAAELSEAVQALIMATCHLASDGSGDASGAFAGDAQLLLDVDLSVLGAAPARFAEYERQIRAEYAWVAPEAYRQGRGAVLQGFMSRPHIFRTALFRQRLEAQAQANLRASLAALTIV